jgi:hypothetical protein
MRLQAAKDKRSPLQDRNRAVDPKLQAAADNAIEETMEKVVMIHNGGRGLLCSLENYSKKNPEVRLIRDEFENVLKAEYRILREISFMSPEQMQDGIRKAGEALLRSLFEAGEKHEKVRG